MKHFDASGRNGTQLNCLTCEREIPEDTWFARLKVGERRAVFCRPQCVEMFLDDSAKYAWRIEPESAPPLLTESKSPVDDPQIPRTALRFSFSIPEPVALQW